MELQKLSEICAKMIAERKNELEIGGIKISITPVISPGIRTDIFGR